MRNKMNKVINWGLSSEMNDFCLKTGSGFETHLYPTPLVWAPGVGGGGGREKNTAFRPSVRIKR